MTNVTILGTGQMGSRMAIRRIETSHNVTVWNRSFSVAAQLSGKGAVVAATPREAVANADFVIAVLRDDEASNTVSLDSKVGAVAALPERAMAIESSTLSHAHVLQLAAAFKIAGRSFIDAPVLGSRPQADAGQLIHLIGGDPELVDRVTPMLSAIGGKRLHTGPVGSGAALKLIANTLFGIQVTAMAESIGRMRSLGLSPGERIAPLAQTPLVSPAALGAVSLMLLETDNPLFPVDLVIKDFEYAIGNQFDLMPVASASLAVFRHAADNGFSDRNLTAVAQLYKGQQL